MHASHVDPLTSASASMIPQRLGSAFVGASQRAWRNAITLIAKREWLLSGDTLTVRRTDEDLTVEIIRRPHGESTAEAIVFALIPVFAAAMARGYHSLSPQCRRLPGHHG